MIREYTVTIPYTWIYIYEDPKCPWDWHGSGVYDIEEEHPAKLVAILYANDEEEAKKMVKEYEWAREFFLHNDRCGAFDIDTDEAEYEETDADPEWPFDPCVGEIDWEA